MTNEIKTADRDEVLFAFHQECERPSAEQIVAWVNRFPQFAEDIRAHAAVAWDWATQTVVSKVEVDESKLARAYSQALNIIYSVETSTSPAQTATCARTFQQMLAAVGKETYKLAREMDVGRGVLADLFNGWMLPPIRNRLIDGLVSLLGTTRKEFNSALDIALNSPRLEHAKSNRTPVVKARSCDDIIRDSNMSPARKRYWLEED
ncbi:MAG: hypothetical protein WCA89_16180 [Terracidiphilus sp.]|jgi:hypothetical protein